MRLYFIRHGETDHNVARRIQGPLLDDPLNARGREQAAALEARFARARDAEGLRIASVYASPMKRAWETAEAVVRGVGVPPPVATPALIEFSWGKYLGRTETGETLEALKEYHRKWRDGRVDLAVEGGESPRGAFARAWRDLKPVVSRHGQRDESFAIVSHGRIMKVILAGLVFDDLSRMNEFPMYNASITTLASDNERDWSVVESNGIQHLIDKDLVRTGSDGPLV